MRRVFSSMLFVLEYHIYTFLLGRKHVNRSMTATLYLNSVLVFLSTFTALCSYFSCSYHILTLSQIYSYILKNKNTTT